MSCSTNTLAQLGSDALNGAAGPLTVSWVSPIETGHAIVLNGTSAFGNGTVGGEAKFVGVTIPSDQFAELQWSYSGVSAETFDLTFRRDPTNVSALFEASFTHNSVNAFLVDNAGVWQSNFTLSSPLATGHRIRVSMLGTQVCVFRNTGGGYVLEHTDTLPAVLPSGGATAGQPGFNLSGGGLANNFATGSVAGGGPNCTLTGTFQYPNGAPVANGKLYMQLSQDAQVSSGGASISGGVPFVITLDGSGSIPAATTIYSNDNLTPSGTTYKCSLTSPTGVLIWGWEAVAITGSSFNLSNFTPPLPQQAGRP